MDTVRFDRLTRRLAVRASRRTALGAAFAGVAGSRLAHTAAHQATPGTTPETGDKPVFMFVQTALSGRAETNPGAGTPTVDGAPTPGGGASYLLTLEGHSGQTIYFSDRPDRVVGAVPTGDFLDGLGFTPDDPPNAALVGEFKVGDGVVALELFTPVYDEATNTLTYGAELLQGFAGENLAPVTEDQIQMRLPAEFASATLFIDDCHGPFVNCYYRTLSSAGEWNSYPCGPIPGGPYHYCWHLIGGCQLCSGLSYDELQDLCIDGYSSACSYPGS